MKGADGSTSGPIPKFVNARGILRYERRNLSTIKADSDQFDALAVPPGLMVRSRDVRPTQIPQPRARRLEPWGRPILRDGRYATIAFLGKHTYLRPPQDEADKWPAPSRFISSGNRFSVPIPKFAWFCGTLVRELRNRRTLATY